MSSNVGNFKMFNILKDNFCIMSMAPKDISKTLLRFGQWLQWLRKSLQHQPPGGGFKNLQVEEKNGSHNPSPQAEGGSINHIIRSTLSWCLLEALAGHQIPCDWPVM